MSQPVAGNIHENIQTSCIFLYFLSSKHFAAVILSKQILMNTRSVWFAIQLDEKNFPVFFDTMKRQTKQLKSNGKRNVEMNSCHGPE